MARELRSGCTMTGIRIVGPLVLLVLGAAPLRAAPPPEDDPVLAGYRHFYNGDLQSAQRTFEGLIAATPASLPAQFGLLQVLEERSEELKTLEPEFERKIVEFLAVAEARGERSASDDEALFYL